MLLRLINLEESGHSLANVDRTHLVVARGKLVLLQKNYYKIVDIDEVNQRLSSACLEDSEQLLENVDRTHLVLASGKQALQRNNFKIFF